MTYKNTKTATWQLLTVIRRFPFRSFANRPTSITLSSSFIQVITGFGAPKTWQISTTVCPSATLVTDGNVLMKLGGSAEKRNHSILYTLTLLFNTDYAVIDEQWSDNCYDNAQKKSLIVAKLFFLLFSSLRGDVAICAEASGGPNVQPHIPKWVKNAVPMHIT